MYQYIYIYHLYLHTDNTETYVCMLIYASSIAVMLGEQENKQKGLFPFFKLPKK